MAVYQDKYRLILFKDNKVALWIFFFPIYLSKTVIFYEPLQALEVWLNSDPWSHELMKAMFLPLVSSHSPLWQSPDSGEVQKALGTAVVRRVYTCCGSFSLARTLTRKQQWTEEAHRSGGYKLKGQFSIPGISCRLDFFPV